MAPPFASGGRSGRRFLLSIHDVWPGNFPLVDGHCRILRSLGATRIALLLVPAYHGRQAMEAAPEFLAWLREQAASGCEIFLHGYHHLMLERLAAGPTGFRRSAWGRWVNRNLVGGEAEFCGLPARERARLLGLGAEAMARSGIAAAGFVAPTWHGAPDRDDLISRGMVLWESRFLLRHLPSGSGRFVPPLAWDAPGRHARLTGGRPWLEALLRLPLFKAAIHPGDLESASALKVLERVFSHRRDMAYAEVFPGPVTAAGTR